MPGESQAKPYPKHLESIESSVKNREVVEQRGAAAGLK